MVYIGAGVHNHPGKESSPRDSAKNPSETAHDQQANSGLLTVLNLGDSGCLVYRPTAKQVLLRTAEQCHDFNFPRQLGTNSDDSVEHADAYFTTVTDGDLIFSATDGVFML